jgi:hypothetical protein
VDMTIRGQHHNCTLPAPGVSSRGRVTSADVVFDPVSA